MPTSLSGSANQFAVDLFQCYLRRHGDKYRNLLLCPYLIYHSLAMMLVGAKGQTAEQLKNLLRLSGPSTTATTRSPCNSKSRPASRQHQQRALISPDNDEATHRNFLVLTEQLLHGNHEFVHLASFIYLDKSTKRTDRYKAVLRDYYETKPKKVEFDNVELMVKTVNEDVARTTENIYNDILSKQEAQKLEKSYMLLVNAVFFRGFWLSTFTDVKKAPFIRCPSQNQQSPLQLQQSAPAQYSVDMMSKLDYLPIVSDQELDARIVKMPFEASDLQMLLILPNDRQSDSTYLCEKISASKINHIVEQFAISKSKTVRVSMPIFCIDSGKISIQSTLVTMGASDLFDQAKANLSGVCENKQIWLNKILHRCFIICDNRGAITSSGFEKAKRRQALESGFSSGRSGVDEFVADHPFMYIIFDSVTKTILLIGLYTDPSETLEVIHENQLSPEEAHQIYTEGVYKT